MKLALTQQAVEKIAPHTTITEYRDSRLRGFLLRVTPTGSKSYYCELGRGQRIFVGRADALGLSEAREAARTYLADHFKGEDPRFKRTANKPAQTLGEFLSGPYKIWAQANQKAHAKNLNRLETAFRSFLGKPLDQLKAMDLEAWRLGGLEGWRDTARVESGNNQARYCIVESSV
jgi:hypothetical protein